MKKALALTCAMTMAASLFLTGCGGSDYTTMSGNGSDNNSGDSNGSGKRVVNVCSWGEYIDEDLIYKFEDETGIKVNYQTAESNEALYSLLKTGAGDYDVIVPSDYMIARLIDEGMLAELRGEPIPESMEEPETHKEKADFNAMAQEEITFTFDTVYVVRKAREDIDLMPLRAYLSSIGDSLVIGEDDETFKVHVHTDIPGAALTESQKYGTLELAKIENMRSQADALAAGQIAQSTDDLDAIEEELENGESGHKVAAPEKAVGFLAICAGDGLAAVFRDLGCDAVVSGGQTMNPSTERILAGIDQVPAETVFVLPNNGNIIMAAQQCQGLTEKNVVVIPSKTVPQGITAMMNVDPEAEVASITEAMTEALSTVTTSQITYAARDSDFDGFEIHQGDYLALKEGKLFGTDTQLDALLEKLAEEGKDSSFISLYYGEDVTEDAAQAAGARFQAVCPDAEISVLSGGQPVYYYIISLE